MGAAVGAALKKVALVLLGDKNTAKKIGTAVLVLLVVLLFPVIAIASVFNGTVEFDTAQLQEAVVNNLSASDIAVLQGIENTMYDIEMEMTAANLPARVKEAQALYLLALFDYAHQPDFVPKLVGCFHEGQSDAQLIASINQSFGTNISVEDFSKIMHTIRATTIDTSQYVDPSTKNNLDLVQWAIAAHKAGWGYVWGTYGTVLSSGLLQAKIEQYPDNVGIHEEFIRQNWLGGRTADCIGFIKGYSWLNPDTGEIGYNINGMPDAGADQMYQAATEKGPISTMPDIPGLAVWLPGHIGIHVGGGQVIHASGTLVGVVKTPVANSTWTHWLKIPYIEYIEEPEVTEP